MPSHSSLSICTLTLNDCLPLARPSGGRKDSGAQEVRARPAHYRGFGRELPETHVKAFLRSVVPACSKQCSRQVPSGNRCAAMPMGQLSSFKWLESEYQTEPVPQQRGQIVCGFQFLLMVVHVPHTHTHELPIVTLGRLVLSLLWCVYVGERMLLV